MKTTPNTNKGSQSVIDQAGNAQHFDPSIPEIAGSLIGTSGGVVSTGGGDNPDKTLPRAVVSPVVKSEAATLREHARKLRIAANSCSYNIVTLLWKWCNVTVEFENNREIPWEEVEAYAKILDQRALRTAINAATLTPWATGPLSCNKFVGAVGKELDIPYFRNLINENNEMVDDMLADNMYEFISSAVNSSSSGWIELDMGQVQDIADEGKFEIGRAHSVEGLSKHAHIVIAVSSNMPKIREHGRDIPCILDGQHAKEGISHTPDVFGDSVRSEEHTS